MLTEGKTYAITMTWDCVESSGAAGVRCKGRIDRVCIPIYRGTAAEQLDVIRSAARDAAGELAPFEARLARAPWLAGTEPTAADAALVPQIGHLMRALGKPVVQELDLEIAPLAERFPSIAAWWTRCVALPGFDRTYPPHWR